MHYHCESTITSNRCFGVRNRKLAEAQAEYYGKDTIVTECVANDKYSIEFEQFLLKKYQIGI